MTAPVVVINPNEHVPLAAIASFEVDEPVETTVSISDGEHTWEVVFSEDEDPAQGLPLLGMRPDRPHTITFTIRDVDGNETKFDESVEYKTPQLPIDAAEFPTITVSESQPDRLEPGVKIMSVRHRIVGQPELNKDYGLLLAVDPAGEVIWYYKGGYRISDVESLDNGNLVIILHDHRVVEIDMLGDEVNSWYAEKRPEGPEEGSIPLDALTLHHEIEQLPSGNLLVLSTDSQVVEDYPVIGLVPSDEVRTTAVMGDEIIEFTPEGEVVWRWNTFDYLDPHRVGYNLIQTYWSDVGFTDTLDWTHGNGLFFDEERNTILVSLRLQDAVLEIDRESGEVLWILGDPAGWAPELQDRLFTLSGASRWFYHQHFPIRSPDDTILLYDNAVFQARPPAEPLHPADPAGFSRAVEYKLDLEAMSAEEVWASETSTDEDLANCLSMGEVEWMPETKNVLVAYGVCRYPSNPDYAWSRLREYDRKEGSEIVWEVVLSGEKGSTDWIVYGVEPIASLQ